MHQWANAVQSRLKAVTVGIPTQVVVICASILLVNLRIPLFGALNLAYYARASLIIPEMFALLFLYQAFRKGQVRTKNLPLAIILFTGFLIAFSYHGYQIMMGRAPLFLEILPIYSGSSLFVIFPAILCLLPYRSDDWIEGLMRIGEVIIWVGGFMMIGLYLSDPVFSQRYADQVQSWLLPASVCKKFGSSYNLSSVRNFGHIGNLAASSAGIGALSLMLLFWTEERGEREKRRKFRVGTAYLGFIAVYCSTSIWNTLVLLLVLSGCWAISELAFPKWSLRLRKHLLKIFACYLILGVALLHYDANIFRRVVHYATNSNEYARKYEIPNQKMELSKILISRGADTSLKTGEYHFLQNVKRSGLLPNWCWVFFLFSFLWKLPQLVCASFKHLGLLASCLFLLTCSLHYDELAYWGNNYIYAILWAAIFTLDSQEVKMPAALLNRFARSAQS